jgi:hypothetical protein
MKITISSGDPKDARDVTVEDDGMEPVSFKADNLADAHKKLKHGLKEGWDGLRAPVKKAK